MSMMLQQIEIYLLMLIKIFTDKNNPAAHLSGGTVFLFAFENRREVFIDEEGDADRDHEL